MGIAAAQIHVIRGDVEANIAIHIHAIKTVASLNVSYLIFPELSLTGYEPELAESLVFSENDSRIQRLIEAAKKYQMYIVVGAPMKAEGLPNIGAFVITPSGEVDCYRKIHLHPGEEQYFSEGKKHIIVPVDDERVGNAICADINHSEHVEACFEFDASIYAAGVLITKEGYSKDTVQLLKNAKRYQLLVAMANYCGETGGWIPAGRSAIWASERLLISADADRPALKS